MSSNLQLVMDPTTGQLLFLPITGGGSGTPGGSDTNIQFNDSGAFGGSDQFIYDKASAVTLQTLTDADTANTVLNLGVHANETNAAALSVSVDGASGNNTPDTTFTFPGAASLLTSVATIQGPDANGAGLGLGTPTNPFLMSFGAADAGGGFTLAITDGGRVDFSAATGIADLGASTSTDAVTISPTLHLGVHVDESNAANFTIGIDGASGNNTPDTTLAFPGAAIFADASGYSFDNTIDAIAYSVNGNAGASGTGTVISAITVENGIITAITVA